MDLRKLKTLIDLVSESNVSELEITEAEGKVRIVKGGVAQVQAYAPAMATPRLLRLRVRLLLLQLSPWQPSRLQHLLGTQSSRPWWARSTDLRPLVPRRLSRSAL